MLEWADDLRLKGTDLYLDSRVPRPLSFVSHAHADHIGTHQTAIATVPTAALAEYRIGLTGVTQLAYGQTHVLDPHTTLRLHSAGHILGSAMLHVSRPEGTLLYTGDFKLRRSLTAETADPVHADTLVMETTYGQPYFRFPPANQVAEQLIDLVQAALAAGRQPIVMGYSLGKAQEITRILTDAGINVTLHGAAWAMCQPYSQHGVQLGAYRRYVAADFHGAAAIDLRQRGVLVAPPHVARTGFVNRFENPCRIMMSGWALLKNAIYRYGVDHALPLSDHADFDELLEMVERVSPRKVYTHHGFMEFAEILKARGIDAEPARPDQQLTLFG